jgi:peptidase C39-like protein
MNYLLIPTLLIAAILFVIGTKSSRANKSVFLALCVVGVVAAMPGILFSAYYLKCLGEPILLYQFRSAPFSELTAGAAGFLTGLLHGKFLNNERFRRIAGRGFFVGVLALGLPVPYFKPIVRPPDWKQFQDKWLDDVCLQTSESSCGPACAATVLRRFGKNVTEEEIARESFTSRNGTENWYLARALRKRGLRVRFTFQSDPSKPWPFPSIAGVRLPASGNNGHFITVLDHMGDKYVDW